MDCIKLFDFLYKLLAVELTLKPLTSTIVAPSSNASKWQMGFNSAFKGLNEGSCARSIKDGKQLVVAYNVNHNEGTQSTKNRMGLIT